MNPFRYRGYYWDSETGFYFLQSRYYDPVIGRFINADDVSNLGADGDLTGYNLYAYCGNNPVMGYDPYGEWDFGTFMGGVSIAIIGIAAITAAVTAPCAVSGLSVVMGYVAGTACIGFGSSEIYESFSGYNPIRDGFFEGSNELYQGFRGISTLFASLSVWSIGMEASTSLGKCFVAGTLVVTQTGHTAIENIQAGDMVWAHDPETGETELKHVVQTFVNEANELVHVFTGEDEIICTNEHPFYSPVKGWTAACKLRAGDILVTVNGEYVVVEKVQHEILESPVKVYNFEVEGYHTYYVGSGDGVLVHNTCDAALNGQKVHKSWDYGQNGTTFRTEVKLGRAGRADAVDFANHIVYELKPNNVRAIRQGWRQLNRYVAVLEQMEPGSQWIKILITY